MSGSGGVSIARTAIRGENRFYNPPPMRRLQQQQEAQLQQQQRKERRQQLQEEKRQQQRREEEAAKKEVLLISLSQESKNRVGSEECGSVPASNLDRFLEHTTPVVPARYLPKANMMEHRRESECQPYFVLEDLWESFAEWSVYGAGVPLLLNGRDSVVQYYVPFLSGIQLYIDPSKPGSRLRRPCEDSNAESLRETVSSDGSGKYRLGTRGQQNVVELNSQNFNRLSLRDKSSISSSVDESEISNPPGHLIFEYLEHDPPFGREPLSDKVSILASRFPELMTYRSCDLLPSSWMSVSWYPIYRIPMGPTLQNLDACFLTFHSLSTLSQSTSSFKDSNHSIGSIKLPLPTFGLASYKFKVPAWNPNGVHESQKANSLLQEADNWLQRLQVKHPDYIFFMTHNSQTR